MKRHTSALVALALSTGLTLGALPANAAETSHFRVSGRSLIAVWPFQLDNCSVAATTVRLAESVIQTAGKPQRSPAFFVDVDYQNGCGPGGFDDPEHLMLGGFTDSATWTMKGDMSGATLSGTVVVSNEDFTVNVPVAVSVTFTAIGPVSTVNDTFHSNAGGMVVNSRFRFSSRPAEATGTVTATIPTSFGDFTYNLTAGVPSFTGSIGKDAFGQVTVVKK